MCPITPAEHRLNDGVLFWEKAYADYFKPDRFRLSLQSAIQAFRSVTFVLQAQKEKLPGFEPWYAQHQAAMRQNPKMRWLVDARNFIEKQGDLTTSSKFKVTLSNSWMNGPATEFPLGPEVTAADVAKLLANTIAPALINEEALLRFDRQWIDSLLPGEEVLGTLIHCYSCLSAILQDAHSLLPEEEKEKCKFHRRATTITDRLPRAMLSCQFPRVAWFKLRKNKLTEYETKSVTLTWGEIEKRAKTRYPGVFDGFKAGMTFREECTEYFQVAKRLLVRDGHHVTIAIIGTDTFPIIYELRPQDRADQHVLMRELASQCLRVKGRSVILISEAWISRALHRYRHAADDPGRSEALVLHAVNSGGTILNFSVPFSREGKKITFGDDETLEGPVPPQLLAVYQALRGTQ